MEYILNLGKQLGKKTILIPTSDDLSIFVSEYRDRLKEFFLFPDNDPNLVKGLVSKESMYELALKYEVPTPHTLFPKNIEDVEHYASEVQFPVMLKGIDGNRLQINTGKKMVIVRSKEGLIQSFQELEEKGNPNLMIQEFIPGGDDQVYIFNGYFNKNSECFAGFTGHKIRQYPIHVGCASLGECRWNQEVADVTIQFMQALGYRGILDIGYRLDPRDGKYKVLDINPRVGQAFRLFLATNGMDVVRMLYADYISSDIVPIIPREGRRWVVEDYDLESSIEYFQEGTLRFGQWLKSFKGVEETAWFNWRDPLPFLSMGLNLGKRILKWITRRVGLFQKPKKFHFPRES